MRRSSDGDSGEIRGSQQREERRRSFYGLLQAEHDGESASAAAHARHNKLAVAVVTGAMLVSATLIFLVRHRSACVSELGPLNQNPYASPGTGRSIRLTWLGSEHRIRCVQAARNNDRMCTRDVSARREPDIAMDSSAAENMPVELRPAVPFAQIEYNGGRNNPLWDYYRDLAEGPVLHKWCGSSAVTCDADLWINPCMPSWSEHAGTDRAAAHRRLNYFEPYHR